MGKRDIKQILRKSIDSDLSAMTGSEHYDQLFQKYEKNLHKSHLVPKMKIYKL